MDSLSKPRLERILLLKAILQEYRVRLDEELLPHGITTAQLRLLWAVEANPLASGARLARLCSVTPQTGQAVMARMEENGWIRRRPSEASSRVLVAELTASGRAVLKLAKKLAERIDRALWKGISAKDLALVDAVLEGAVGKVRR